MKIMAIRVVVQIELDDERVLQRSIVIPDKSLSTEIGRAVYDTIRDLCNAPVRHEPPEFPTIVGTAIRHPSPCKRCGRWDHNCPQTD